MDYLTNDNKGSLGAAIRLTKYTNKRVFDRFFNPHYIFFNPMIYNAEIDYSIGAGATLLYKGNYWFSSMDVEVSFENYRNYNDVGMKLLLDF